MTSNSGHIFASDGPKSAILCSFERKSLVLDPSKNFKLLELTGSALIPVKEQISDFSTKNF